MNENEEAIESLAHEMWTMSLFGPPHTRCPYQTAKGHPKEENADYSNSCGKCKEHLIAVATIVVESDWLRERIAEGVSA